jgi:hypothetical protein
MIDEYDDVGVGVGGWFVDGFEELLGHHLHFWVLAACLATALLCVHLVCLKELANLYRKMGKLKSLWVSLVLNKLESTFY